MAAPGAGWGTLLMDENPGLTPETRSGSAYRRSVVPLALQMSFGEV